MPFSSNIPLVQLTRVGSILALNLLGLTILITTVVVVVSAMLSVSLSTDIVMLSSIPVLSIPSHLTMHKDLHIRKNIDKLRFKYDHIAIIYGIVCDCTGLIYLGGSWDPVRRFNKHLIKMDPDRMNAALLADIKQYGLDNFTVYVFTTVSIPRSLPLKERKALLLKAEQSYIDMFPWSQTYNSINAKS